MTDAAKQNLMKYIGVLQMHLHIYKCGKVQAFTIDNQANTHKNDFIAVERISGDKNFLFVFALNPGFCKTY